MDAPQLRDTQIQNFFRSIRDEDSFTIVYEIAHTHDPVAIEDLCRTFGAEAGYLKGILLRLDRLGVITKAGKRWTIHAWAKATLEFLEERIETAELEVPETSSDSATINCIPEATISVPPGTCNGLWTGAVSHVTAADHLIGFGAGGGTIADTRKLAPENSYRGQNESRTHDYK